MKRVFYVLIFFSISLFTNAQNEWVQKLSYSLQMQGYYDTLTGVRNIEIGPDGSVYVVATINQHNAQKIFKFFPNSHQLEWSLDLGYHHATGPEWIESIRATADSGVIICHNFWYSGDPVTSNLLKYSKTGTLDWHRDIVAPWPYDETAYDVIEKSSGGYYVLIQDSMYTLDAGGNFIDSTGAVSGRRFLQMTNGDLLVKSAGNLLSRFDTLGNLIWSQFCSGLFAYDTASVFMVTSNSLIKKVDALSGVQIWNKTCGYGPISGLEATHDGGYMASIGYRPNGMFGSGMGSVSPGYLVRADSSGDTLWTRTYTLPRFGLSTFKIMPNGNIFTGGCYMSGVTLGGPPPNFSAFCCMMNADGSYPLEQTSYVSPPDANNDHKANFVDDALETMLALGATGIPLDSSLDGQHDGGHYCDLSDISIDWNSWFSDGVNHKHADCDANGIIDTNDVISFNNCLGNAPDSSDVYYRLGNEDHINNVEEFCLLPVNDTIQPGDIASYYMVMGNNANPVDSIYGFAFSYFISEWGLDYVDSITIYNTNFGSPGIDLWSFQTIAFVTMNQFQRNHTLICRTDFQNAYAINDTLGIIHFRGLFNASPFTPTIADFKAILADGSSIPFNVCSGSIFIDSSSVFVTEKDKIIFKISPNPANELLTISFSNSSYRNIVLMNSLGEKVKEIKSSEKNPAISVADLPIGFYFGTVYSGEGSKNFSFVVQH